MTAPDPSPDPAVEGLADLIGLWRDEYPRLPNDMDSAELADRIADSEWLAARDAAQQRIGAERATKSVLREVERGLRGVVVMEDSMASDEDELRYVGQHEVAEGLREWLADVYDDTDRADRIAQEEA